MAARVLKAFLSWVCAATLFALAAPASATDGAPTCVAYSAAEVALNKSNVAGMAWDCSGGGWRDMEEVTWLRFDLTGLDLSSGEIPASFSSRITVFEEISIAALSPAGMSEPMKFSPSDAQPIAAGAVFVLPLPELDHRSTSVVVRVVAPHSVTIGSEARISDDPEAAHDGYLTTLIIALVAGMLLTPLLFDINFFLVLRERFVLLHAGMVVAMLGYVLFAGGLISAFFNVPLVLMAIGAPLFWAVGVALGAFFMTEFLEPRALPSWQRRLTSALGWWTLIVPGFFSLQFHATQAYDNIGYFLALTPVLFLYSAIIVSALWRGSRAARFLAAAWLPLILAATERLMRGFGLYAGGTHLDHFMFLAMGIEVIIIALGVADRFLAVRRERDSAIDEARSMVELSEHDPLTGLLNRRALELRLEHLQSEGFQTLALVDLDRFKDINDQFGHSVGDSVLRSAAAALAQDRDCLAFRMGGEEFLLLLRGNDALNRAERLRQGIPTRVAADIEGLDRLVTASAGVIDLSSKMLKAAGLASLYNRADKLLYEAKEGGRNRTVSEKLKVFSPRAKDRRQKSAA